MVDNTPLLSRMKNPYHTLSITLLYFMYRIMDRSHLWVIYNRNNKYRGSLLVNRRIYEDLDLTNNKLLCRIR